MIRWYDYIAAAIVAHSIFTVTTGMFIEDIWWKIVMNAIAIPGWMIIWDDHYTKFRLKQETKNDR
jgi:hypothetical protein